MIMLNRSRRAALEVFQYFSSKHVKILDFGCGYGETIQYMVREGFDIVGIDPDCRAVEEANKRIGERKVVHMDQVRSTFPDESFEAILFLDVLEHVQDPRKVHEEITRLLKPSGLLVLSVPHKGWSAFLDPENIMQKLKRKESSHKHYSFDEVQDWVGEGFEKISYERRGVGLSQLLRLLTYPIRRFSPDSLRRNLERSLSIFGVLEYSMQTGVLGYHLFTSFKKCPND